MISITIRHGKKSGFRRAADDTTAAFFLRHPGAGRPLRSHVEAIASAKREILRNKARLARRGIVFDGDTDPCADAAFAVLCPVMTFALCHGIPVKVRTSLTGWMRTPYGTALLQNGQTTGLLTVSVRDTERYGEMVRFLGKMFPRVRAEAEEASGGAPPGGERRHVPDMRGLCRRIARSITDGSGFSVFSDRVASQPEPLLVEWTGPAGGRAAMLREQ